MNIFQIIFTILGLIFNQWPSDVYDRDNEINQGFAYHKLNLMKDSGPNLPWVIFSNSENGNHYAQVSLIQGQVVITSEGTINYHFPKNGKSNHGVTFGELAVSSERPNVTYEQRSQADINYFHGAPKASWRRNLPGYYLANLGEVFDGVTIKVKARGRNIEKLFLIAPGSNPDDIKLRFEGIHRLSLGKTGELEVVTDAGTITFTRPIAFQEIGGKKTYVSVSYWVNGYNYGFRVGNYDPQKELIIDPLVASTYLGGSDKDGLQEVPIAKDSEGNIFMASRTQSLLDFPLTEGTYGQEFGGGENDVFIAKFNSDLSELLAATYLGGNGDDGIWPGLALKIDLDGNIIVAGRTNSPDFPRTDGVLFENHIGGFDTFIAKLDPNLENLIASTYFGGTGNEYYIKLAVAQNNDIFISGTTASSNDFPRSSTAFDTSFNGLGTSPYPGDLFISRISSDLTALHASTFLGGHDCEFGEELLVDATDNVYLAGWTSSSNFPTTSGAYDRSFNGGVFDAFISGLDGSLTDLIASTYLGGSEWDFGYALAMADDGTIYITGHTASRQTSYIRFPISAGVYQETYQGGVGVNTDDAFVAKFNHTLTSLLASTYFGASAWECGFGIQIGNRGKVYLAGNTNSLNFQIPDITVDSTYAGGSLYAGDVFVAVFDGNLTDLEAFSYLGGQASDCLGSLLLNNEGVIYLAGTTNSTDFPTTPDTYQYDFAGGANEWYEADPGGDAFIARLDLNRFTRVASGPHVNDYKGFQAVCWIDYDNDNYPDLYVIATALLGPDNNCLYRNNGNGTYSAVTDLAIVNDNSRTSSASWADYDNDGDLDLCLAVVTGSNILYDNDGEDGFNQVANTPIDDVPALSTTISWIDFNLDYNLDLFIGNSSGPSPYDPFGNFLFLGDGDNLTPVTEGVIVTDLNHTYGASWSDYDDDGYPDLVAPANVGRSTDLYHNNGDGTFTNVSSSVICQSIANGAGSSWADYDNDGDMDLFIGGSLPGPGYLYRNNGDATFSEVVDHGLGMSFGRAYGGVWGDCDNDGDQDIIVWSNIYSYPDPDYDSSLGILFINSNGNFTPSSDTLIFFGDRIARAIAWGDSDRDGDLDIFVAMSQLYSDPANNVFYQNNSHTNNWITVKPVGTVSNKSGVGTKIRLRANIDGNPVWQLREVMTQTATGTQYPLEAHFGLGNAGIIDTLKIEWSGGQITDILTNVVVNQYLTITETICGNANGDGQVNILDIIYLIDYKFKNGPAPDRLYAGDTDGNGQVNILDIICLINFKFKNGPTPNCP